VNLLKEYSLKIPDPTGLLYKTNFINSRSSNLVLQEIYYIVENNLRVFRLTFEKIMNRINDMIGNNQMFNTDIRDYIIYIGPFLTTIVAFIGFCLLLSKIKKYKITIQKVFFLIDIKEIDQILLKIENFNVKNEQFQNLNDKVEASNNMNMSNLKNNRNKVITNLVGSQKPTNIRKLVDNKNTIVSKEDDIEKLEKEKDKHSDVTATDQNLIRNISHNSDKSNTKVLKIDDYKKKDVSQMDNNHLKSKFNNTLEKTNTQKMESFEEEREKIGKIID